LSNKCFLRLQKKEKKISNYKLSNYKLVEKKLMQNLNTFFKILILKCHLFLDFFIHENIALHYLFLKIEYGVFLLNWLLVAYGNNKFESKNEKHFECLSYKNIKLKGNHKMFLTFSI